MRLIWLSLRQRVTQFYRRTLGILQIAGDENQKLLPNRA